MRKGLILLAIAATAVMFISGCVATGQAKASHIDIKGKTIAIKSGRWFEDCDKWESNDKINIAFSSSKPVKFSAHYSQKGSTETIDVVDGLLTDWYEGSISVQGDEVYCFMWHNDNFEDITLTYDMGVGEETAIQNVLLDNDKVKVVENVRHPGYLAKMHSHGAYIAYFFGPCKLKFTFPDGKTKVKEIPAGKLVWSDGTTHEVEVLGNTDLHTLHIEFK